MSVNLSPLFNDQTFDSSGDPAVGYQIFTYAAGSSTKQTTYSDSSGATPQTNPIIINASGYPTNGPIWLTAGLTYKFVLALSTDTDPPASPVKTIDGVTGVNDSAAPSASQWISSGVTPTYVNATTFSVLGDQTTEFHVGRKVQTTTSGGTIYGTIATSAYTSLTTVTLTIATGSLDAGLSVVNLSILRNDFLALPAAARVTADDVTLAAGKVIVFEGATDDAYETTLTVTDPTADRTATLPDMSGTVSLQARGSDIASASTINLSTASGDIVDVTGTTTITAITLTDGIERTVRFTGALTLTHGASLVLQGAANITTAAGDIAVFRGYASGVVRCTAYQKASGKAVIGILLGTPVASTSGTSIDFTSIPSGVKRVTVTLSGVSTSGTSPLALQMGDSGGIENTGYTGATGLTTTVGATTYVGVTSAFPITYSTNAAANTAHGAVTLTLLDSTTNTWVLYGGLFLTSQEYLVICAGSKSLSTVLDRIRITTVGGTDTFDAGTINITYE